MNCEKIELLLSSYIDGELKEEETNLVDKHIGTCAACKTSIDVYKSHDKLLCDSLTGIKQEIKTKKLNPPKADHIEKRRIHPLVAPLVSLAAGFIIAVALFFAKENSKLGEQVTDLQVKIDLQLKDMNTQIAKLLNENQIIKTQYEVALNQLEGIKKGGLGRIVLVMGNLEITDGERWTPAQVGMVVTNKSKIKSVKNTKASLILQDGSEIRLNEGTEVSFDANRNMKISQGEIWASIKRLNNEDFVINTTFGDIQVKGTEINILVDNSTATLAVIEGKATMVNKAGKVDLKSGELSAMNGAEISPPSKLTLIQMEKATKWTIDLLLARGRDNPEVEKKIKNLLALMGESKVEYLTEEEIKSFGTACVIPIAKYIESEESKNKPSLRKKAIKILSDIGDWYAVQTFIKLLTDEDQDTKLKAANGLYRVTSIDQGYDRKFWEKTKNIDKLQKAQEQWQKWWDKVKSEKIGVDPEKIPDKTFKKMKDGKGW